MRTKYKLIEAATGNTVTYGDDNNVMFGGPWGQTDPVTGEPMYIWVENILGNDELLQEIRSRRNQLLAECDWTQLADVGLNPEKAEEWQEYRRQLRDFPETCDPLNPEWPTKPE